MPLAHPPRAADQSAATTQAAPAPASDPLGRAAPDDERARRRYARPKPTGLWRAYLAAGRGGVAEIRRWALWMDWTGSVARLGRRRAIRAYLERPLDVPRIALRAVRRHGGWAAEPTGRSPFSQWRDMVLLWLRHRLRPEAYYQLQLFRDERRAHAGRFLQHHESTDLLWACRWALDGTEDRSVLRNKHAFEAWCGANGFPSATTVAVLDGDHVIRGRADALPAADLFVKPVIGKGGMGTSRWGYDPVVGAYRDGSGGAHSPADLVAAVGAQSRELDRPLAIQRCLANHPDVRPLTSGALCTVRTLTAYPPTTGPLDADALPALVLAVLRMPTGAAVADNFDLGAVAAAVDLETGRLTGGVRKRGVHPADDVATHPDTGAHIADHALPDWPRVVELARRAHRTLPQARTVAAIIGWDIALTPDGPVLVECNAIPGVILAQMPSGVPLGDTAYAAALLDRLRTTFL